jgi:hypothetical protein
MLLEQNNSMREEEELINCYHCGAKYAACRCDNCDRIFCESCWKYVDYDDNYNWENPKYWGDGRETPPPRLCCKYCTIDDTEKLTK